MNWHVKPLVMSSCVETKKLRQFFSCIVTTRLERMGSQDKYKTLAGEAPSHE